METASCLSLPHPNLKAHQREARIAMPGTRQINCWRNHEELRSERRAGPATAVSVWLRRGRPVLTRVREGRRSERKDENTKREVFMRAQTKKKRSSQASR